MPFRPAARTLRSPPGTSALSALGCAALACAGGADEGGSRWALVHEELPGALMSVVGNASDDVWTVGADDGDGPAVLHYDGESWRRIHVELSVDLWWVHVVDADTLLLGGTDGTILRGNADDGFEAVATPDPATVYGLWGLEGDLWAVGSDPESGVGFVWRDRGEGFQDVTPEIDAGAALPPVFKVWGRELDDVWLVGFSGLAVHWDGTSYDRREAGSHDLFTVHGTYGGEPSFVAVGGIGNGVIEEYDGSEWRGATLEEPLFQLFGVCLTGVGEGYAVGAEGSVARRDADGWRLEPTGLELYFPFHSVWVDPSGGVWAAGGNVVTSALNHGMLLYGSPGGQGPAVSGTVERSAVKRPPLPI